MKRTVLYFLLALSILVKPVMANDFYAAVSADHTHIADHNHHDQEGEHAQLDVDSEGNPHDGAGHSHQTHQSCEYSRPNHMSEVTIALSSSTLVSVWKDRFYSDYSSGPLLEPPSRA